MSGDDGFDKTIEPFLNGLSFQLSGSQYDRHSPWYFSSLVSLYLPFCFLILLLPCFVVCLFVFCLSVYFLLPWCPWQRSKYA